MNSSGAHSAPEQWLRHAPTVARRNIWHVEAPQEADSKRLVFHTKPVMDTSQMDITADSQLSQGNVQRLKARQHHLPSYQCGILTWRESDWRPTIRIPNAPVCYFVLRTKNAKILDFKQISVYSRLSSDLASA